ncbi:MAG: C10 family peptidase [Bacteroidetes bacterium]|nr:C10 family peptidase [Bacteroidota bacterium]
MKKIESENKVINTFLMRMSLLIMLFVFMANCLCAESVGEEKANQVAVNFLQSTTGLTGLKAILNYKQIEPDGAIDFYVFNFDSPNAFVIVTGDDIFQPVIAYSTESVFDVSNVNQFGVSDWISDVQNQMREALKSNIKAEPRIAALWFAYISGSPIANPQAVAVTPLLTTTWDQSQDISGSPHYNSLCPFNNNANARSLAGCVATAMAQIMKYWNQPAFGLGSHSYNCVNSLSGYNYGLQSANFGATAYDWANMPNSVTSTSTNAIDILLYHCGVAVEMEYGLNLSPETGSGSTTIGSSPRHLQPM